jgi:hypothetical protein
VEEDVEEEEEVEVEEEEEVEVEVEVEDEVKCQAKQNSSRSSKFGAITPQLSTPSHTSAQLM